MDIVIAAIIAALIIEYFRKELYLLFEIICSCASNIIRKLKSKK